MTINIHLRLLPCSISRSYQQKHLKSLVIVCYNQSTGKMDFSNISWSRDLNKISIDSDVPKK